MSESRDFLVFNLGPVQSYISAARSVRDLWAGSYILSWLTFRAMKEVITRCDEGPSVIVSPDVTQLPLWQLESKTFKGDRDKLLEPCIPNRFIAEIPSSDAETIRQATEDACRGEWRGIAEQVRQFLYQKLPHDSFAKGDSLWQRQIDSFFEIYSLVIPQNSAKTWQESLQHAMKCQSAVKSIRQYPKYVAGPFADGMCPQKCSLMGTFEHMGPGERQASKTFWETASKQWHERGTRVTANERLCAISLVKRYFWPQYLSDKLNLKLDRLRFSDTATLAAAHWLAEEPELKPDEIRREDRDWSGQWLHWSDRLPKDVEEVAVPIEIFETIQEKKAIRKPPTYYAMFVYDGDGMGDLLKKIKSADAYREMSGKLGSFAIEQLQGIIESPSPNLGQLIYAGGDDVLCLMPTERALACVMEIQEKFTQNWKSGAPKISGGLVIAHHKEDLRFVLGEAHAAEKRAKQSEKNLLAITVCRRSGEHSKTLVPWDLLKDVNGWVNAFLNGASDRWAYQLRADIDTLAGLDSEIFKLEMMRQLNRSESKTLELLKPSEISGVFDKYYTTMCERRAKMREPTKLDPMREFVTLVQTASFLARGRDA